MDDGLPLQLSIPTHILIVDDHPNTASMLARTLEAASFSKQVEIRTASNGEEALQLSREKKIDVLIVDFMMPRMNGLELVEALSGLGAKPGYIIFITAHSKPELWTLAKRLGVDRHLIKPIKPDEIQAIIRELLEKSPRLSRKPEKVSPAQAKVLLADDNQDHVRLYNIRLREEGYRLITAYDGDDTLRLVRSETPDLVLLDIAMPKKGGLEVLAEMRSDPALTHIPVILISAARIGQKDIQAGLDLGADDYILKPIDWEELFARMKSRIRTKRVDDELRRQNRDLRLVGEIVHEIHTDLDYEALGDLLVGRPLARMGATAGFLTIFYGNGGVGFRLFRPHAWEAPAQVEQVIQEAAAGRKPVLVEALIASHASQDRAGSVVAAPLLGKAGWVGVLGFYHDRNGYFAHDQLSVLHSLAGLGTLAIERSQLQPNLDKKLPAELSESTETANRALLSLPS